MVLSIIDMSSIPRECEYVWSATLASAALTRQLAGTHRIIANTLEPKQTLCPNASAMHSSSAPRASSCQSRSGQPQSSLPVAYSLLIVERTSAGLCTLTCTCWDKSFHITNRLAHSPGTRIRSWEMGERAKHFDFLSFARSCSSSCHRCVR